MQKFVSKDFSNTYEDIENCVKINNKYKYLLKMNDKSSKKQFLKDKDSYHSKKNMRKTSKSWKDFNQFNNLS